MARIANIGWETRHYASEDPAMAAPTGGAAFTQAQERSGDSAIIIPAANAGYFNWTGIGTPATGTDLYYQFAFRLATGTLTDRADIAWLWNQGGDGQVVPHVATDGVLKLLMSNASPVTYSSGVTITRNQWYVMELRVRINTGSTDQVEMRLDGTTVIATQTLNHSTTVMGDSFIGNPNGNCGADMYIDDFVVNDSTGTDETSWVDQQKVDVAWPISENSVHANWLKPGGASTNRHTPINTPPSDGVAHSTSAGNAEKQIYNIGTTNPANADFNCETYTTVGVGASDLITAVQTFFETGVNSTTARAGASRVVSNPAQSADDTWNFNTGVTAGTFPTGWNCRKGTILTGSALGTPTKGTSPVIRGSKRNTSTDSNMFSLGGLIVTWKPVASVVTPPAAVILPTAAAQRAASW